MEIGEREGLLRIGITALQRKGWRVKTYTSAMATMESGRPFNHWAWFFSGFFTFGLSWALWILVYLTWGGQPQISLWVDERDGLIYWTDGKTTDWLKLDGD